MRKYSRVWGAEPFLLTPVAGQPSTTKSSFRLSLSPLRCKLCVMAFLLYLTYSLNLKGGSPSPMLFLLLMEYQYPNFFKIGRMGTSPFGGTFEMISTVKTVFTFSAIFLTVSRTSGRFFKLHFPSMIAEVARSLRTSSRSFPVFLSDINWVTGFSSANAYPKGDKAIDTTSTSLKDAATPGLPNLKHT